jgi:Mannosyltransferase (PIG-V)
MSLAGPQEGVRKAPVPLRSGLRYCALVFAALRAGVFALCAIGFGILPRGDADAGAASIFTQPKSFGGWRTLFTALQRNDANWFLRLATTGYQGNAQSPAFFPGYPLAIRALDPLVGSHPLLAATLLSNLSLVGALVFLYSLTAQEFSESIARTTIACVAVFPTAFFFLAPYSESQFLLLSVMAFWAARRDRWLLAAIAAAAAGLTRSVGILVIPALAFEAFQQWREEGRSLAPRIGAAIAGAIGPLSYFLYWQFKSASFMAPVSAQAGWERTFELPWMTVARAVNDSASLQATMHGYWIIDVLVTGAIVIPAVLGARLLRPSYIIYAWSSLVLPLLKPYPPRPLLSDPRFVLVVFPAFWVLAAWTDRGKLPRALVLASFAAALGLLCILFINWYDIF